MTTHWLLPNEQISACGIRVGAEAGVRREADLLVDCLVCRAHPSFAGSMYMKSVMGSSSVKSQPDPQAIPGYKTDNGKPRWELLPFGALGKVAEVMTCALTKYPPGNWKKVPDAKERYFGALHRHLAAWRAGEKNDVETGLPHLAHAACDLLFTLAFDQKTDGVSEEEANK